LEVRRQEAARRLVLERSETQLQPGIRPPAGIKDPIRTVRRTQRQRQQERRLRRAPQQVQDQLEGGLVGPVDVVEHERHGPLATDQLEQRPDRAVEPEPLRRPTRPRRRQLRERGGGQHRTQLGPDAGDARRMHLRHVVVERVDRQGEGHLALVRGRAPAQGEEPGGGSRRGERVHQCGLPDPGLTEDRDRRLPAVTCRPANVLDSDAFLIATDELHKRGSYPARHGARERGAERGGRARDPPTTPAHRSAGPYSQTTPGGLR
jgi:hypothetical protein